MLKEGGGHAMSRVLSGQLEGKLSAYSEVKGYADTIASACYFLSKVGNNNPTDNTPCYFFYYWLGKILFDKLTGSQVPDLMNIIYTAWKRSNLGISCIIKNIHDTDKSVFEQNKKKFDLSQDYHPKQDQLKNYYELCDSGYKQIAGRGTAPTVPNNVQQQCKSDNGGSYCKKFRTKYSSSCNLGDSSKLTCTIVEKPQIETHMKNQNLQEGAESHNDGTPQHRDSEVEIPPSTPTATIAVPSAIATLGIGIPTVLFFLYKYDLLPSGIINMFFGNNSSNRNRRGKRRSTGRNFDRLTEYTTEGSSTIEGSSTTDYSTASELDVQSTRAGTTNTTNNNNTPPGHHHRKNKNIRYQRM
ncbi:Uncharacterized protein PCOAH_00012860 [Plasmodium coatneyi]|uniref:KIR protein n=1 Tax=Plasmodium coatneyi TaxID=208452 RepID=A0A1B1DWS1_9APIC|nr:Uncharacterized protein PCOAH_00012860 [Plasmodium coatneyi]ANQ07208.1 Uncharacterized protein PCOAH_00012860 [Plasmodium coatneyi]